MKRKRIYISIPISGHDLEKVKEKARQEKIWVSHWYDAITPFDVCPDPDKPYSYYMGKDIEALLECDAIYLCEGWQNSKGCITDIWKERFIFHSLKICCPKELRNDKRKDRKKITRTG